jgi:glutathione S-transferase|eukprot:scaffold1338_cov272-Chaetoceros_neogracile.AAC.10
MIIQNCKLTYFDFPGRGESARIALSIGNVKFTDDRIQFPQWKELKPTTPWGSLPVLTLSDGTEIAQQRAILRLIGKATGLYPTDVIAAAKVDSIMDAVEDIGGKTNAEGQGLPQAEKEAARKAACTEEGGATYEILKKIDSVIGSNEGCYAVGNSLTIADLCIYVGSCTLISGLYDGIPKDALDSFHNLAILRKAVRSNPAVSKWYDGLDKSVKVPTSFGKI